MMTNEGKPEKRSSDFEALGAYRTYKSQLKEQIETELPAVVEMLLAERSQAAGSAARASTSNLPDVPSDTQDQWDLFRALVNTRPPLPASDELLASQNELLQHILTYRGTTTLQDIPPLPGREGVRLWRGDITTLATDAIVNAANSQMLGCFVPGHHCIDNAIHTFAGIQLRLECARLMNAQGYPEPTGMAKMTSAFNLPSKHIVHTVGPIAEGFASETDKALLANCYTACLDAAASEGCSSIAFCCISTGVFGFPQEEAARIAIRVVDEWLARNGNGLEVVFNVFSERDERIYRELLQPAR